MTVFCRTSVVARSSAGIVLSGRGLSSAASSRRYKRSEYTRDNGPIRGRLRAGPEFVLASCHTEAGAAPGPGESARIP
jgi:hypothetical protein